MRKLLFFLEFTFGEFLHARKVDTIHIYFQIVTIIFACFYATLGLSVLVDIFSALNIGSTYLKMFFNLQLGSVLVFVFNGFHNTFYIV